MFAIRIAVSVLVLAGGLWATFRPTSSFERKASERPIVSITYQRVGILAGTIVLIAFVWM
jgi:hypothetical protein